METELSFQNAFEAAGLEYIDPYSCMKMGGAIRIRQNSRRIIKVSHKRTICQEVSGI